MKKFFGKTNADLIVTTEYSDIIINVDMKLASQLMVNDKLTLTDHTLWLNYIQIFATKEKNNPKLIEFFQNYTITIIDRYFDGNGICLFGRISDFDMKELNNFLATYDITAKHTEPDRCNHILPDGRSAMILCGSDNDMTYVCSICNEQFQ